MIAWLARRLCGRYTPVVRVILLTLVSGCSAGLATKPAQRVTVTGQLSDHNGRPIAGWQVLFDGRYDVSATTDSSGRYSASIIEGTYLSLVFPPWDFRGYIQQKVDVSREHNRFNFRYDAYRVSGRLLNPLGAVIDSGYVSGGNEDQDIFANQAVVTGTFALVLPAGSYDFYASAKNRWSGYPSRSISSVPVGGDTTFDITLVGDPVTGVLRGPGGAPLAGASVQANGPHTSAAALTGPTGQYAMYLPPDSYRFLLSGPSYILPRITNPYPLVGPSQLDFDLAGTHWSGSVHWSGTGNPYPGAAVRAVLFADSYNRSAEDTTDSGGGFDLFLESGREYLLSVTAPGLAQRPAISVIAGADTTFDISVSIEADSAPRP